MSPSSSSSLFPSAPPAPCNPHDGHPSCDSSASSGTRGYSSKTCDNHGRTCEFCLQIQHRIHRKCLSNTVAGVGAGPAVVRVEIESYQDLDPSFLQCVPRSWPGQTSRVQGSIAVPQRRRSVYCLLVTLCPMAVDTRSGKAKARSPSRIWMLAKAALALLESTRSGKSIDLAVSIAPS